MVSRKGATDAACLKADHLIVTCSSDFKVLSICVIPTRRHCIGLVHREPLYWQRKLVHLASFLQKGELESIKHYTLLLISFSFK